MTTPTGPDDSTQVLTSLRAHRAVRDRAELAILNDVLDWCVLHETDDEDQASFGDHGIPLAGDGAPWVSEFAVMELGAALGGSTDSAKRFVGAALEIRYRLPRVWERVASGDLPFWKAKTIAENT
ncbi:MAG: HNH endonuclease, partial [Nocardioides sp.]|nr:HNH endonuclease [Nocardioides sp.]